MSTPRWTGANGLTETECRVVEADAVLRTVLLLLVQNRARRTLEGDAARSAKVEEATLRKHFQRLGHSFHDVADALRLGSVAEALVRTDTKIEAIARRHGYAGGDALVHAFRRVYGTTPSEWRRAWRTRPPSERDSINRLRDSINRSIARINPAR